MSEINFDETLPIILERFGVRNLTSDEVRRIGAGAERAIAAVVASVDNPNLDVLPADFYSLLELLGDNGVSE